jgi:hypothetical protein
MPAASPKQPAENAKSGFPPIELATLICLAALVIVGLLALGYNAAKQDKLAEDRAQPICAAKDMTLYDAKPRRGLIACVNKDGELRYTSLGIE